MLPLDLIRQIFRLVDYSTFVGLVRVSKVWAIAADDDGVWRWYFNCLRAHLAGRYHESQFDLSISGKEDLKSLRQELSECVLVLNFPNCRGIFGSSSGYIHLSNCAIYTNDGTKYFQIVRYRSFKDADDHTEHTEHMHPDWIQRRDLVQDCLREQLRVRDLVYVKFGHDIDMIVKTMTSMYLDNCCEDSHYDTGNIVGKLQRLSVKRFFEVSHGYVDVMRAQIDQLKASLAD